MLHLIRPSVFVLALLAGVIGPAKADYAANTFQLPGMSFTSVWDIGDNGQLVGGYYDGSRQYGYIYDAGQVTRLDGPIGAVAVIGVIGISNSGIAVGNWVDALSQSHPFVYQQGQYLLSDLKIDGYTATLRAISPDGRYLTGFYRGTGLTKGFVYDLVGQQVLARIEAPGNVIAQGINSYGQVVGSYGSYSFLYDVASGTRSDFSFAGISSVRARAINDQGQIAGWLSLSGSETTSAWIGNASGYQLLKLGLSPQGEVGQGINNLGQVVGYTNDDQGTAFIASPVVLPQEPAPGANPHVYSFSTAVVADVPVFLDPLVAIGYAYKTGTGDPLFKSVSLPAGVGDNQFELVVQGQRFVLAGNEIFDFSAHGFSGGVAEFSVLGIEPSVMLDPTNPRAFVTRVTFAGSGMFTGTQTALTLDYAQPVPEPASALLMLAGGLVLFVRRSRAHAPQISINQAFGCFIMVKFGSGVWPTL